MNRFFHRYRKAIVWTVVVGFALSIVGMGMFQRFFPGEPGTAEEVILSVAGRDVTREELSERYERLLNYYIQLYEMYGMDFSAQLRGTEGVFRRQQLLAEVAEGIVREALLEQEARRYGISVPTDEVDAGVEQEYQRYLDQAEGDEALLEQYLAAEGLTLQEFKRQLRAGVEQELRSERLRVTVTGPIEPSDEELESYYERNRERYREEPEKIRISHIQLEDEELGERLLEEVRGEAADWAALAEEHSVNEETRQQGGELDWFSLGESGLPSVVERAALAMDVGEVDLVQDADNWHLVRLLERRDAVYSPLEEVWDEVLESYAQEERNRRWEQWYQDLRRATNVDIREPLLEAFVTYGQDREAGLEILEREYGTGNVADLYAQLYLGRMHESLLDTARGEVSSLEELEELSPDQQADLEEARARVSRHRDAALEYYLGFVETGEADERVLERILQLNPDQVVARYRLGEVYRERGEYVEAREQYESVLELDPEFVAAYIGQGDVAMARGLYARATEYYLAALDLSPDSLSLQVKLAEAHLRNGDHSRAEELLEGVLAEDERNVTALTLLGDVLMDQGEYEGALQHYDTAYQRNPTSEVQLRRARALAAAGREDEAESAFRNLLRQFPYRAEGYVGLGDIYAARGEEDRAVEQYRLGLRQAPDVVTRELIARRIVELRPDDVDMRFRLAGFLKEMGDDEAAAVQYEEILNIEPHNIHAHLGIGDYHLSKEEYGSAVESYNRALDAAETRAEKLAVYDKLITADERATGSDEPLTEVGLEALWQRALLRQEAGELQQARSDLQRVHDTDPEYRADEVEPLLRELGGTIRAPGEEPEDGHEDEATPDGAEQESSDEG